MFSLCRSIEQRFPTFVLYLKCWIIQDSCLFKVSVLKDYTEYTEKVFLTFSRRTLGNYVPMNKTKKLNKDLITKKLKQKREVQLLTNNTSICINPGSYRNKHDFLFHTSTLPLL